MDGQMLVNCTICIENIIIQEFFALIQRNTERILYFMILIKILFCFFQDESTCREFS